MARRMISALRSRCCMPLAGLLVLALWGNAQADTLLLHNGDRLTGTLISIADEKLPSKRVSRGVKGEQRVVSQIETSRNYIFRGAAFEQRGQLLVIDGNRALVNPMISRPWISTPLSLRIEFSGWSLCCRWTGYRALTCPRCSRLATQVPKVSTPSRNRV